MFSLTLQDIEAVTQMPGEPLTIPPMAALVLLCGRVSGCLGLQTGTFCLTHEGAKGSLGALELA